jgi:hypothetical protein
MFLMYRVARFGVRLVGIPRSPFAAFGSGYKKRVKRALALDLPTPSSRPNAGIA